MTGYKEALRWDITANADHPASLYDAASAYEEVIQEEDAPLDAFVNLAVLYWNCLDPGFNAGWQLSNAFIRLAGERYKTVLYAAEERFGYKRETEFWKLYFDYVTLGEPEFNSQCEALVAEPMDSLVPYFYLYSRPNGQVHWQQALELLGSCKLVLTIKNRYIISVMEGEARRRN